MRFLLAACCLAPSAGLVPVSGAPTRPATIMPPAVTFALATLACKYELAREEHARRVRYVWRERQIKEAKGDREAAHEELDLGRPVEGKGPVGRRMVGEWRCMDQGVMLHDLKDLDNLAQRYRVLLAASQVVQRVVDECNELRARATTPDDHSAWQLLVMRVGVAQEKIADLHEQFYELHGTDEELRACKEKRAGRPRNDARARLASLYDPLTASNTDGRLQIHSSLRLNDKTDRAKLGQDSTWLSYKKGQRAPASIREPAHPVLLPSPIDGRTAMHDAAFCGNLAVSSASQARSYAVQMLAGEADEKETPSKLARLREKIADLRRSDELMDRLHAEDLQKLYDRELERQLVADWGRAAKLPWWIRWEVARVHMCATIGGTFGKFGGDKSNL